LGIALVGPLAARLHFFSRKPSREGRKETGRLGEQENSRFEAGAQGLESGAMPDSFVHLHCDTEFSTLDGMVPVDAAVKKAEDQRISPRSARISVENIMAA
jgi:hypothetical protein